MTDGYVPAQRYIKRVTVVSLAGSYDHQLDIVELYQPTDTLYEHVIVYVMQGATGKIIDAYGSYPVHHTVRAVSFLLHDYARLRYSFYMHSQMARSLCFVLQVRLQAHASFEGYLKDEHVFERRYRLRLSLEGAYADARLRIASRVFARERVYIQSVQQHTAPQASSHIMVKTIVDEAGAGFYKGCIVLEQDAQKSETEQQQAALLLASGVYGYAEPALEVKAHHVRCRHGSAIGQLSREALWYLAAHGVSSARGQEMLLNAFMQDVLDPAHKQEP